MQFTYMKLVQIELCRTNANTEGIFFQTEILRNFFLQHLQQLGAIYGPVFHISV